MSTGIRSAAILCTESNFCVISSWTGSHGYESARAMSGSVVNDDSTITPRAGGIQPVRAEPALR